MKRLDQEAFYNKQFARFRPYYDKHGDALLSTAAERIKKVLEATKIQKRRALELG